MMNKEIKKVDGRKTRAFTKRNNEVLELLKEGKSYVEIGVKMGVTKQRIYQLAKKAGISKWGESREAKINLVVNIKADVKAGLSYEELKEKYGAGLHGSGLAAEFRTNRNNKIIEEYKSTFAKEVLKSDDPVMDDPLRLTNINSVYNIAIANGFRKYPNIGNRSAGGLFEDPRVIKIIKEKREKSKLSFNDIAIILNGRGYVSPMGKKYTENNVCAKYRGIKKYNK